VAGAWAKTGVDNAIAVSPTVDSQMRRTTTFPLLFAGAPKRGRG